MSHGSSRLSRLFRNKPGTGNNKVQPSSKQTRVGSTNGLTETGLGQSVGALKNDLAITAGPEASESTVTAGRVISDVAESPSIKYNALCQRCRYAFQHIKQDHMLLIQNFHTNISLLESVQAGCHFCSVLWACFETDPKPHLEALQVIENKAGYSVFDGKQVVFHAELAHWTNTGLCFNLRDGREERLLVLVSVELQLGQLPDMHLLRTLNLDNLETWDRAIDWMDKCLNTHEKCKLANKSVGYPRRLLDISTADGSEVKVCETVAWSHQASYATLSYCWGGQTSIQLTTKTYDSYTRGIKWELLPRTFKDAIQTTGKFKLRYLWIDALCIIQDTRSDWIEEASNMHAIYANCRINIAATVAKNADVELFRKRNPLCAVPCSIQLGANCLGEFVTTTYGGYDITTKHAGLDKRGWVFQERVSSPRVLHFSSQEILWECRTLQASQVFPGGFSSSINSQRIDAEPFNLVTVRDLCGKLDNCGYLSLWRTWNMIIELYSGRALTRPTDQLVAVAGLARQFQSAWCNEAIRYVAGLWTFSFRKALLWSVRQAADRPPIRRAPSWSWASVSGQVAPYTGPFRDAASFVQILSVSTTEVNDMILSGAIEGTVLLRGSLNRFRITREKLRDGYLSLSGFEIELYPAPALEGLPAKARIDVNFDDCLFDATVSLNVFLMPFEIKVKDTDRRLEISVQGLVLHHLAGRRGVFSRIGKFRMSEDTNKPSIYSPEPWKMNMSQPTIELGCSSVTMPEPTRQNTTICDLDSSEGFSTDFTQTPGHGQADWATNLEPFLAPIELLAHLRKEGIANELGVVHQSLADDAHHQRQLPADDPFGNGPVCHNFARCIVDKYPIDLYPSIYSFLVVVSRLSLRAESPATCYKETHGKGLYTISIV